MVNKISMMNIVNNMYNPLTKLARRIKGMVTKNLMSMALMGIPLSFVLLILASDMTSIFFKVILLIGSAGLFISAILCLRQANKLAKEHDDELINVLRDIRKLLKVK
jgi:hypothetical protein